MLSHRFYFKVVAAVAGLFILVNSHIAIAQTVVSTIAGGNNGDGHLATDVGLYNVFRMTSDSKGNLYFLDNGTGIRKIDPTTGLISTYTNILPGGDNYHFSEYLFDINASPDGTIFAINGNTIKKMDKETGVVSIIAGGAFAPAVDGIPATQAFLFPQCMAIDSAKNVYLYDIITKTIKRVDAITGILTTVAGNGTDNFTGENSTATTTGLGGLPIALACDGLGNLFFNVGFPSVIRKVSLAANTITTVAGTGVPGDDGDGGLATAAQISTGYYLSADKKGNLYFLGRTTLRKIDVNTGLISSIFNKFSSAIGGSYVDGDGTAYIFNSRILRSYDQTNYSPIAGNGYYGVALFDSTATHAQLEVGDLAISPEGKVAFASYGSPHVFSLEPGSGRLSIVAGTDIEAPIGANGGLARETYIGRPYSLVFDKSGNLYYIENHHFIRRIDKVTGITTIIAGANNYAPGHGGDGGSAAEARLNLPTALAIDKLGNIYITDGGNRCIRKIDIGSGLISTVAGVPNSYGYSGDGAPATAAQLKSPLSIAVDNDNNLFIADVDSRVIRKVDGTTGIISTIAGNGNQGYSGEGTPALSSSLGFINKIIVDGNGDLILSEDSRIRKIALTSGIITTIGGTGEYKYNGENLPALQANISPGSLAFDSVGNLIFTDISNSRIRKINFSQTLPLKYLSFSAKEEANSTVLLTWKTSSEKENALFDVLKSSGQEAFYSIGRVKAGTLAKGVYSFSDKESNTPGTYYYYLNQFDKDGKSSKSNIVSVTIEGSHALFPNPASKKFYIKSGAFHVEIFDMNGRLVLSSDATPGKAVDISGLSEGIYSVKMANGTKVYLEKLLVR